MEINEQIARKLGWTDLKWSDTSGMRSQLSGRRGGSPPFGETVPPYSTSIEAAWEIVESVFPDGSISFSLNRFHSKQGVGNIWECEIGNTQAEADTAPMAIVKCFLKLDAIEAK